MITRKAGVCNIAIRLIKVKVLLKLLSLATRKPPGGAVGAGAGATAVVLDEDLLPTHSISANCNVLDPGAAHMSKTR